MAAASISTARLERPLALAGAHARQPRGPFLLHAMFNAYWEPLAFELPPSPTSDHDWRRCIDTALASPDDICRIEEAPVVTGGRYVAQPRSVVLLALGLGTRIATTARGAARAPTSLTGGSDARRGRREPDRRRRAQPRLHDRAARRLPRRVADDRRPVRGRRRTRPVSVVAARSAAVPGARRRLPGDGVRRSAGARCSSIRRAWPAASSRAAGSAQA